MQKIGLLILFITVVYQGFAYEDAALPANISAEITAKQVQYDTILAKECPDDLCVSLGCQALKYVPLKKTPNNSLPGFSEDMTSLKTEVADYLLTSFQCGFAYEPLLTKEQVETIQKRIKTQMNQYRLDVQIRAQPLNPKVKTEIPPTTVPKPEEKPIPSKWDDLWQASLPFLPWIFSMIITALLIVFIVSRVLASFRSGRTILNDKLSTNSENSSVQRKELLHMAPEIVFEKAERLRRELMSNQELCKRVIQPLIDERKTEELFQLLRYFGTSIFNSVREEKRNFDVLEKLAEGYAEFRASYDVSKGLTFLDWIESKIAGISVRVKTRPVHEAFAFLQDISEAEYIELMKTLTEEEVLAVLVHSPSRAITAFINHVGVEKSHILLEKMVSLDSFNESSVRELASRLSESIKETGYSHRKIVLNHSQVLERMIHVLPSVNRHQVIQGLIASSSDKGHLIKETVFLEDALPYVKPYILNELILEMDENLLIHYLLSLNQALRQQIIQSLNHKLKNILEQKMNSFSQPVSDVLASSGHELLSQLVKTKVNQGLIDLGEINQRMLDADR